MQNQESLKNNVLSSENICSSLDQLVLQTAHPLLYESFSKLIKKVFHDDLAMVQDYDALLLREVLKLYGQPGGVWKLKQEILSFDEKHLRKIRKTGKVQTKRDSKEGPLKILIVSGMFPCTDHGGGLRLFDIVRELCDQHSVDIFAIYNPKLEEQSYELLKDKLNQVKLITEKEMTFDNLLGWLGEINQQLVDYDFVQFEYPHSIPLIQHVSKYSVPTGFTFMECQTKSFAIYIHNMIKDGRFQEFGRYVGVFWNYLMAEKQAVDNADYLIPVTSGDAKAVREMGAKKTYIIPTCISNYAVVDEIERYKDIVCEESSVAFLGYYGHYPNIDGMIWYLNEIHPIVQKEIPDYKMYVIGRGDTSRLEAISNGDPNVIYTGRVDNIIPPILRAKVCTLPLVNGAGIRGKINQYSIAGRPSVTTWIGNHGLKYVDEESTLLADDPTKFANNIIRLLTDSELYEKIRTNAKKIAEDNYTWKNHLELLVNIYRGKV